VIKDYYKTLGLTRSASHETIRKRYRELVLKFHPDKFPNDPNAESRFADITEAYHHLGDLDRRIAYHTLLNRNESIKMEAKKRLRERKRMTATNKPRKTREEKLDDLLKMYGGK
jgi:DnaJ-class molecular chaperone